MTLVTFFALPLSPVPVYIPHVTDYGIIISRELCITVHRFGFTCTACMLRQERCGANRTIAKEVDQMNGEGGKKTDKSVSTSEFDSMYNNSTLLATWYLSLSVMSMPRLSIKTKTLEGARSADNVCCYIRNVSHSVHSHIGSFQRIDFGLIGFFSSVLLRSPLKCPPIKVIETKWSTDSRPLLYAVDVESVGAFF